MPDRNTLKHNLNDAGKAYKSFLKRQEDDRFFTTKQKNERKRTFLENHVGLFNDYLEEGDILAAWRDLTTDARELGNDVSREFPDSEVGRKIRPSGNNGNRNRIAPMIENLDQVQDEDGEIDLEGQVLQTYRNRTDRKAVRNGIVRERDIKETEEEKALKEGITPAQNKGIRAICAWMYRTTKKHQKLVEGIAARTPREKLLMFYIIENDKRHHVTQQDMILSQHYIPSLERFEQKIYFKKHWYKQNINWDLVADASSTAFQAKSFLGALVSSSEPERKALKKELVDQSWIIPEEKGEDEKSEKSDKSDKSGIAGADLDKSFILEEADKGPVEKEDEEDEHEEIFRQLTVQMNLINSQARKVQSRINNRLTIKAEPENAGKKKGKAENGGAEDAEDLQELGNMIGRLNTFVKGNDFLQKMALEVEAKHPEGPKGKEKWNVKTQKHARYMVLVQALCNLEMSTLGTMKKQFGDSGIIQGFTKEGMIAGGITDSTLTIFNALAFIVNITGLFKSYASSSWQDVVTKGGATFLSFGNTAKSGVSAVRTGASLFSDASWGSAGTSAVAAGLKTGTGIAGVALGSISTGMGVFNLFATGNRKSKTTAVEQSLNNYESTIVGEDEERKKQEKEGERQILKNVIAANRNTQNRLQTTAALQSIQGGLNTASGVLTLMSGPTLGISTFVALGLSGLGLLVGLGSLITQIVMKGGEITDIIDRYINMDSLYRSYQEKYLNRLRDRDRNREIKRLGGEKTIKKNLRDDAAAVMGFPSQEKLYASILWQYANTLYDVAFRKKEGGYIQREDLYPPVGASAEKVREAEDRKRYVKMIKALGFKVSLGKNGGEPTPGPAAIHKKLMQ